MCAKIKVITLLYSSQVLAAIRTIQIAVVDFLFIVTPIVGVCNFSLFCCTLLYVHSSFAIILMGKRELIAMLICPPGVSWLLCGSSSRCHGFICSL